MFLLAVGSIPVTPITLKWFANRPVYASITIPAGTEGSELKRVLYSSLESHGVTCDRILDILDDVRADPTRLSAWVNVE